MNDTLFIALQRLTPQHWLSRSAGLLANCENPWIKNQFISWFANKYQVNMDLAIEPNPLAYPTFNEFFTRALKPEARPIDPADNSIVSPADGAISQIGDIDDGRVFQAKGQSFSVLELLGGDSDECSVYQRGKFATIYLSPRDYHRVHMPAGGRLRKMVHVPGQLFSVNQITAEHVPRLFARNERVVCHFDTDRGPMVVVLVGAMIVASIETVWAGLVTPVRRVIKSTNYSQDCAIELRKGEELGRFLLGSTAIILFPSDAVEWRKELRAEGSVAMGQRLGRWCESKSAT